MFGGAVQVSTVAIDRIHNLVRASLGNTRYTRIQPTYGELREFVRAVLW